MNEELKSCPLCPSKAVVDEIGFYRCQDHDCAMNDCALSYAAWQALPRQSDDVLEYTCDWGGCLRPVRSPDDRCDEHGAPAAKDSGECRYSHDGATRGYRCNACGNWVGLQRVDWGIYVPDVAELVGKMRKVVSRGEPMTSPEWAQWVYYWIDELESADKLEGIE